MKWLSRYSSQDLLYIAILSALGLAVKPIVTPLIHLISAPLMIPGGSLAGGLYMMWLVLAVAIVKKPGAGFLVALTQSIVMLSIGFFGSHGAVSLISYTLPGIVIEITSIFFRKKDTIYSLVWMCTLANITGAIVVTILVMRLALIPLFISLVAATISGIIGGILSYSIYVKLTSYNIIQIRKER
ncbi:MAG: ECF transporter S component [Candidatus Cloacimonetes bacterium]|nr:ECF transporter S component [Candidatus Cloacimonadota bacterium]